MRWSLIGLLLFAGCTSDSDGDDGAPSSDAGLSTDATGGETSDVAVATDVMGANDVTVTNDAAIADTTAAEPDANTTPSPALMNPDLATAQAPATYAVLFETTAGDFTVNVTRAWAPRGADRFFNLVQIGYYDDVAFFRVIEGFMAQTGIHGEPSVNAAWSSATIADDPNTQSNTRGRVSFATAGPDTRTTQIFFNFGDNGYLDNQGFSPFGEVVDMTVVDALHNGYGDGPPNGSGPDQGRMRTEGNPYLKTSFSELDYIERARLQE